MLIVSFTFVIRVDIRELKTIVYSYAGNLPVVVPASFNPVGNAYWKPRTDPYLRADLASSDVNKGASIINTTSGLNVQESLDTLRLSATASSISANLALGSAKVIDSVSSADS